MPIAPGEIFDTISIVANTAPACYDGHVSDKTADQLMIDARDLATKAGLSAGRFLTDHFRRPHQVSYKGRVNLMTEADRGSEQLIADMIAQRFPNHRILGEEGTLIGTDAEHLWIIDPLDGTSNYAHGYPNFSVSIAFLVRGQVALGVVYDPLRDELFVAERGKGAYLGDQRLTVSSTDDLIHSLAATGFPYDRPGKLPKTIRMIEELGKNVQTIRADGSAALDLCYVAAGRFDLFWENDLSPWDTAAGSLMVWEAGGRVTDTQDQPYDIFSREVVATNGHVHQAVLGIVTKATPSTS